MQYFMKTTSHSKEKLKYILIIHVKIIINRFIEGLKVVLGIVELLFLLNLLQCILFLFYSNEPQERLHLST